MTSQSEPGRVEKQVIEDLNALNSTLPQDVVDDIARVRQQALLRARAEKSSDSVGQHSAIESFTGFAQKWRLAYAAPVAVAVLLSVLVSYDPQSSVPALPASLLSGDVPAEDLAMLEDLEFASWLAEQESEVVL